MAELATIARPYAEALFKSYASEAKTQFEWLDALALAAADPQLLQFADNPKVSDGQVYDVLVSCIKANLDTRAQNFIRTLIENNRLAFVPEIVAQYRTLVNAQKGTHDAMIFSAFPIDDETLAQTKLVLEKRFGRKLNVAVTIQPELIGGIRVVVGDEVLDTTVKARLEQMKVALMA
ncbi:MAG: F0F1 ATP synthase subunit delta [Rhodoferax sp.]